MPRGRTYDDVAQTMGDTPLIRLRREGLAADVVIKHAAAAGAELRLRGR